MESPFLSQKGRIAQLDGKTMAYQDVQLVFTTSFSFLFFLFCVQFCGPSLYQDCTPAWQTTDKSFERFVRQHESGHLFVCLCDKTEVTACLLSLCDKTEVTARLLSLCDKMEVTARLLSLCDKTEVTACLLSLCDKTEVTACLSLCDKTEVTTP